MKIVELVLAGNGRYFHRRLFTSGVCVFSESAEVSRSGIVPLEMLPGC